MGVKDGLSSLEENSVTFSGTTVLASVISGATINGVTSLNFAPVYTGSPSIGNNTIQFGAANAAGIANAVTVSFGTPFAVAPTSVQLTALGSVAVGVHVLGVAAGSFTFAGAGSNISYAWLAAGSGRL